MKIALVGRGYSLWWGGAERVMVELSKTLADEGADVEVLVERLDESSPPQVPVRRLRPVRINSALKLYTFHRAVAAALKKMGDDRVIFGMTQFFPLHIYWAGGGVYRHWMRLRFEDPLVRGVKYILSPAHYVMRWLEQNIMKPENHRHIITNSRLVKEQIVEYFGLDPERITVIYNGIDHSIFNPQLKRYRQQIRREYQIAQDELLVLFVANNWERKGLRTLIGAMAMAEFSLMVVGRGRKEPFIKEAERCGIDHRRLIFTGPQQQIERFYGAADLFVLPTQYDPCSGVCLEAMAAGLPVITTASNGAAELVDEADCGFVMEDWRDHRGLAALIERLRKPALRDRFARAGTEKAASLTWKATARKMLDICSRIAQQKGMG